MLGAKSIRGFFDVARVNKAFRRAVPRRVPSVRPFKGVPNEDIEWMKERAYAHAGLEEFTPCWTGEMASRPIPFVSTDSRPLRTLEVFKRYLPHVMSVLLPDITPAIQAFNKVSSLGYPIGMNPGDGVDHRPNSLTYNQKVFQSKFDVILEYFQYMQDGDFSVYRDGYHTIGCRKQNEPPSKLRTFQFINAAGEVYEREIGEAERMITVPSVGEMVGSRTRTIVRPPLVNLWLQCWDTLLHNSIKRHPLFESNVYNKIRWPEDSRFVTFDCKHYERYLGLCAIAYAEYIGGRYGEQLLQLIYYPFVVPSDDWTAFYEIRPLYKAGVYPQFSSGLSPVAPLGKLTNLCVQVAYFHEFKKLDVRSAVTAVLSGSSHGMRRWCFGDDNRIMGSEVETTAFCAFMGEHFEIEIDETPTYLGTIYRPDLQLWCLPARTYNLKLYQPERDYEWKEYPNLGMVARRQVFTEYGEPEIANDIIPFENDLWDSVGHPFVEVATAAVMENQVAQRSGISINKLFVTDKEYLMTEAERAASGLYWHLKPDVTASIVLSLVGADVRDQLPFAAMKPVPVPVLGRAHAPFVQTSPEGSSDISEESEIYAEDQN